MMNDWLFEARATYIKKKVNGARDPLKAFEAFVIDARFQPTIHNFIPPRKENSFLLSV
jgi:hypothetical protein